MNSGECGAEREVLVARAYLSSVAEPPAPALACFVEEHGPRVAADLIRKGTLPKSVADEVDSRRDHVCGEKALETANRAGARLVVPEQREWPGLQFSCLSDATAVGIPGLAEPLGLWVRGSLSPALALHSSLAIVGARAATGYGEHLAAEFGHALGRSGFTVVSGAAYGIDGASHRGALAAGCGTVAFLACGVNVDYPAGHGRLLSAIADSGAVVSEYPPGTPPRKHRFLVRNRLIAASQATLVVEAGARSGASNTANTADTLGRPVMALPGPVTSASSVGCHEMVRSGRALLVTKPDEVLEIVRPLGSAPVVDAAPPARTTDALEPAARKVHDALGARTGASAEQLARDSGVALRTVRAVLPNLEMTGLAVRGEQGWSRSGS